MSKKLENIQWQSNDFAHTFIRSLHTSLYYAGMNESIAQVAGRSGFAFRTIVHKELCPSAMSVFDWDLLKEASKNCGVEVDVVTRLWHEDELEPQRREEAVSIIKRAIDRHVPTVAWDLTVPEWELVTGYDDQLKRFDCLSVMNKEATLEYDKLGRREIPILFVMAPGKANGITAEAALKRALQMAVDHSLEKEFCERPDYQDGHKAYELWAKALGTIKEDDWSSRYYLSTYECMRRLAVEYLQSHLQRVPALAPVVELYKQVHSSLNKALTLRNSEVFPDPHGIKEMQTLILQAGSYEKEATERIAFLIENELIT
ncbi:MULTISPECIES: hypothetical protein [unclassified Fusibacter]|uniref:hypothetical protein n=1 Tax=unclassified Fusibacter TaxID=2624464 RepID=UPI001011FB61|nr:MULTISPECIES: hypothetical protein [unclassified Fusibacter]MCK8060110.1 hypothetical protein [Fusibacter sp. A2]NPE22252.1 hypothetical protein [Fusibacter sp. A1]RXV61026.1 hypothetical protein DWB64_10430 [Fusibacter sp. A1]